MDNTDFELIFTDLDSIFDTRLATYELMDPTYPDILIKHGYFDRCYDRFDTYGIMWDSYREAYSKRDKKTLTLARTTSVILFIHAMILDKEQQAMTSPLLQANLLINTYPYILEADELKLIIDEIHRVLRMGAGLSITTCHMAPADVTPEFLKQQRIYDWITFNGEDWLSVQLTNKTLTEQSARDTVLHLPALVSAPCTDPKAVLNDNLANYRAILSPFIRTEFIVAEVFSNQFIRPE